MDKYLYRIDATRWDDYDGVEKEESYFILAHNYAHAVAQVEEYIGQEFMTGITGGRDFDTDMICVSKKTAEVIVADLDGVE